MSEHKRTSEIKIEGKYNNTWVFSNTLNRNLIL